MKMTIITYQNSGGPKEQPIQIQKDMNVNCLDHKIIFGDPKVS